MGDAYRTRGRLNSDVALKDLPGDLVRDPVTPPTLQVGCARRGQTPATAGGCDT